MTDSTEQAERPRARAVFSTVDFGTIKEALAFYIKNAPDGDERVPAMSALYHRLGRVD